VSEEKLKEFIRRLEAEGYRYSQNVSYKDTVYGGSGECADIKSNGDILFQPEYRDFAMRVSHIRDEVEEYMTAYLAATPDSERSGNDLDTRTLLMFSGNELAGRQSDKSAMDFVTWQHNRDGFREFGHYFNDYESAKRDFAVRAGLIDRDRLFTETELTVIRSNLSDFITIDGGEHISWKDEDAVKDIIRKIDNVIVPEIKEQAEQAKEEGYEPEHEL
jgi:hypothetical protein